MNIHRDEYLIFPYFYKKDRYNYCSWHITWSIKAEHKVDVQTIVNFLQLSTNGTSVGKEWEVQWQMKGERLDNINNNIHNRW